MKFYVILLTKNLHIINKKLINLSPLQPIHAGEFWSNHPLLVYGSKKKQEFSLESQRQSEKSNYYNFLLLFEM